MAKSKMTFEEWKKKVDEVCKAKYGLTTEDLPDIDYYTLYEEGCRPASAAAKAIKNAMD